MAEEFLVVLAFGVVGLLLVGSIGGLIALIQSSSIRGEIREL